MSLVKTLLFDVGCCWKQGEDREDKTIVKGELTDSATLVADKSAETGTSSDWVLQFMSTTGRNKNIRRKFI